MRKLAILGAVLICTILIVSGVQAQRALVPGDDGSAMVASPVPVTVANVPAMTVVDGVIDVRRIRRPVEVTGTVNVGNLPLDADGNVRAAVVMTSAAYRFRKVAENVAFMAGQVVNIGPVPVAGWRHVQYTIHLHPTTAGGPFNACLHFGGDGVFAQVSCIEMAGATNDTMMIGSEVFGPEAQLSVQAAYDSPTLADVWVYLSN